MQQQAFNEFVAWGKIIVHEEYVSNGAVICMSNPESNTWLKKVIEELRSPGATQRASLIITLPAIDGFPACYVFGPDNWTSSDHLVAINQLLLDAVIDTSEIGWFQDYIFGTSFSEGAFGVSQLVAVYSQFELLLGAVASLRVDAKMWTKILAYRALDR